MRGVHGFLRRKSRQTAHVAWQLPRLSTLSSPPRRVPEESSLIALFVGLPRCEVCHGATASGLLARRCWVTAAAQAGQGLCASRFARDLTSSFLWPSKRSTSAPCSASAVSSVFVGLHESHEVVFSRPPSSFTLNHRLCPVLR